MAKYVDKDGNEVKKVKKPFFKRIWVWVVAIIIVIAIFNGTGEDTEQADAGSSDAKTETASKDKDKEKKEEHAVGDKVTVKELAFQVNGVEEETELKAEYLDSLTTSGKYIVVDLEVFNNDKESRIIDSEMFRILDKDGTEYSPTSEADMYINDGDLGFFLQEINPNLSKTGKVAFEVPEDTENYTLQVSSGFGWSGGEYEEINISE